MALPSEATLAKGKTMTLHARNGCPNGGTRSLRPEFCNWLSGFE
jgi:hypothetical protein